MKPDSTDTAHFEPRVPIPEPSAADPALQETFKAIEAAMGRLPDLFKSMASYPRAVKPLFDSFNAIYQDSDIDQRLQQIALIRASVKNGSDYCLHLHMDFGLRAGLTHKQIDALRYKPGGGEFTEKEQVVIEYADQVTQDASAVSDALFTKVRRHFNDAEIVNLTLIVSMINVFSRYADALKLHPDD